MIRLTDFNEEIDDRQTLLGRRLFTKENSYLWERPIVETDKSIRALYRESLTLDEVILTQYINTNWLRHFFIILPELDFYTGLLP